MIWTPSATPAAVYRVIHSVMGTIPGGQAQGLYSIGVGGALVANGNSGTLSRTKRLIAAHYADPNSGLTTKLRVSAWAQCNATDSAVDLTIGLHPATVAGGAGLLAVTLGAAVTSVVVPTSGVTSASALGEGTDLVFPTNGLYAVGLTLPGASAANGRISFEAEIEIHHVAS